jgi:hypothetical protein
MLFVALLIAHPTMAPRKHLPKTAEAARNDGCNLLTDFFKKNRAGRPKKRGNSANDDVQAQPAISNKKKKRGPIPLALTSLLTSSKNEIFLIVPQQHPRVSIWI